MASLNPRLSIKKRNFLFDSLKSAAKFNVAFVLILKNLENESCCD